MVVFFAVVGTAMLLVPGRFRSTAMRSSERVPSIPLVDQRGWVRSRYYVPTLRMIGVVSLAAAAFLLWLSLGGSAVH